HSSCSLQPSADDIHYPPGALTHRRGVNQRLATRPRQRLEAMPEGHPNRIRTTRVTAFTGQSVDPGVNDTLRRHVGQTARMRLGHERSPHPQSAGSASETRLAIVVTAKPGHRYQIIREAGKPAVAQVIGGSGLASQTHTRRYPIIGRTPRTYRHDPTHRLLNEEDGRRIELLLHFERIAPQLLAVGGQHV